MKNALLLFVSVLFLSFSGISQEGEVNQTDGQGRKQGQWEKKYENGQVRYQGQFKDDVPVGTFFYYSEKGAKSSEVTYTGDGWADAKFFHDNGTVMGEGQYKNQVKEGLWKFYDDQTVLSAIENYSNGKRHGTSTVYLLNGQPAAVVDYVDGLKTGPFKEYFSDGKVMIEGTYLDDNFDGAYKQYYGDGQLLLEGQYKGAVKHGLWVHYNGDGRIKVQQVFDKGKLVKEKYEEGFEPKDIPMEVDEEEQLNEKELKEEYYRQSTGGG